MGKLQSTPGQVNTKPCNANHLPRVGWLGRGRCTLNIRHAGPHQWERLAQRSTPRSDV